jgi:hypothetical protein
LKTINKGDKVRSYYDPNIFGIVVEIFEEKIKYWTMEGTQSVERYCVVRLKNGNLAKQKTADLYIEF